MGVPIEHLQGGKLAIYELMAEESAVNYWEKYGNVSLRLPSSSLSIFAPLLSLFCSLLPALPLTNV